MVLCFLVFVLFFNFVFFRVDLGSCVGFLELGEFFVFFF